MGRSTPENVYWYTRTTTLSQWQVLCLVVKSSVSRLDCIDFFVKSEHVFHITAIASTDTTMCEHITDANTMILCGTYAEKVA